MIVMLKMPSKVGGSDGGFDLFGGTTVTTTTTTTTISLLLLVSGLDDTELQGSRIMVQHARGPRPRDGGGFRGPSGGRTDYRVTVEGLSRDVSWQDLKVV